MSRLGFFLLASLLALPAPAQESPKTQEFAPQAGPTATVDQSPSSQVLTLEEVLSEALAKNPGVQSALHTHDAMHMDEMKRDDPLMFDRCSPGAFAFAKKEDAEAFIAQNGGQILTMEQLLGEANLQ